MIFPTATRGVGCCYLLLAVVMLVLLLPPVQLIHGFVQHHQPFASSASSSSLIATRTTTRLQVVTTTTTAAIIRPSAHKIQIASQSNNFMRGKMMLVGHKLCQPPSVYKDIFIHRIMGATYWPEIALIVILINSVAISKWIFEKRKSHLFLINDDDDDDDSTTNNMLIETTTARQRLQAAFEQSRSLKFARVATQIGVLQAILYISDVCCVCLKLLGFKFVEKNAAQHVSGSVIFSLWLARSLSQLKFHILSHPEGFFVSLTNRKHHQDGSSNILPASELGEEPAVTYTQQQQQQQQQQQTATTTSTSSISSSERPTMGVYNRFANQVLDVIIYLSCSVSVVDTLGIWHLGFAFKSIFGLGSFGTLVLSLASRDVAAEFVGGLMVQSSNFVDEGEVVVLQDGTRGTVAKIGWLHTYILTDDDFIVRVPNSQISHQRIARLKRERGGKRRIFYKP